MFKFNIFYYFNLKLLWYLVTKCPQLSDDVKISDAFLNTFLQMVQVENIPTCCLLIVGNKASLGKANLTDGSHQVEPKYIYLFNN